MSQIIIGFTTEGTTDIRLLESIIVRTFVDVGFECNKQIEIISPALYIKKGRGDTFSDQMLASSKDAYENGVMTFCIHADSDSNDDKLVLKNKIEPAFKKIIESEELLICKNLVHIIPVYMSEAWMLADKELFKEEIGTDLSDEQLGINHHPESFNDPKNIIMTALRIASLERPKRRRKELSISELYQPIGQKIALNKLEALVSFQKFKEEVRNSYRLLNYLE